jgi:glycolate oxidase
MFHELNDHDITVLRGIVGDDQVRLPFEMEEELSHDELKTVSHAPDVHVLVQDKHQVAAVVRHANERKIPLTVRGSGTGLVGACVPVHGGILLDMSKMNKIVELDETNMTLTVEPGVLLMDIASYVEPRGFFYAPDPGEKSATIGGNIATNAGGMRAVKYGVTRDWVRGLEVVFANGEIATLGGKVVKNSSGYALKDLIIGSEGTLAVIVAATLKLIPLPAATISLLIPFSSRQEAIDAVPRIIGEHSLPTAVEFLEQDSLAFSEEFLGKRIPHADHPAYLLVSYDGSSNRQLEEDVEAISALVINELGARDVYTVDTDERKQSVWSARGAFLEAIKASTTEIDECDVVLPRSQINEFLAFTRSLADELEVRIPYFGHAGDGNLHIYFCRDGLDQIRWDQVRSEGFERMYNKAFTMGGLVSGEHGIGYAKRPYLVTQVGSTQINIMSGIKRSFDPNGILNPGKVL